MRGGGSEGELRKGRGVRELLTCLARRLRGRTMGGLCIFGVLTRNERGSVVREGSSASGRRVAQVREFLEFPEELIKDWPVAGELRPGSG